MAHRFSSRLEWELPSNALARLLARKRDAGARILDLTESNPTRVGLTGNGGEILSALTDSRALVYEPSPAGLASARQAVSGYYAARGFHVAPDRILLTAGTSEAYAWLLKLLADPGDEILVPRPSYPLFEFLARLESASVRQYPLHYHDGWWMDLDALEAAITPRTRAVVVVNPNNPTGSFLKREETARLVALCAERELAILADEVFSDYPLAEDLRRVRSLVDVEQALVFCLSGLSKVAGLPQMKLGWIVAGGPPPRRREALSKLELIADTYLSVGAPVQHAAARLLRLCDDFQRRLLSRLHQNLELLRQSTDRLLAVEGGWYAVVRAPLSRSDEEWALALLEDDDLLVQPGYFYDFGVESLLVVSLLPEPAVFGEALRRLLGRLAAAPVSSARSAPNE